MAVNKGLRVEVETAMRLLLVILLASGIPAFASAQDASEGDDVRSADEVPKDMPAPPENAPPAEAPAVGGTDDRPPHPETPQSLEEQQPSAELLTKTSYQWLPGHWIWTGEQFDWKSGEWIYKVKNMILVPPRWDWDGKQWVFYGAGWAKPGTKNVVYSTTSAPGGPDVATKVEQAPPATTEQPAPQASTTTVYVWTGAYVAPLILFPVWHPYYHYHWYHRHAYYRRPPAYRSARYHYSHTHRRPYRPPAHSRPPSHGRRPPSAGRPPSSGRPPNQGARPPSTRPSTQP
ncbi:MAG: hypothetical protein WBM96_03965, partial [Polyangiales bacterium]